ncbi:MAG: hypothetical protein IPO92_19760 [Saprospiraceae bacterium]|nr:hypothetical protein [Saprospiraceae bacterium]
MSGDQNIVSQKTSVQSSINDDDITNTAVTSSNKKVVPSGLNKIQTTVKVDLKTPALLSEQSINAEAASIIEGNNVSSKGNMILPDDVGNGQQFINRGSEIMTTKPNTVLDDMPILLVQNISFLPALKYSKLISTQNSHLTYELNFAKPATILPSKNKYFGYTEIYASGGLSHWNLDKISHQLSGAELMFNASEKSLTSINFGIRTDISLRKHIYTSTGLECLGLYSVYEYAGVKEVLVEKTNVVTQIRFDLLSNSSTNIYGDTTVYESQNRNAKKRNSIFNVSVPVILGVQSRMGKWNLKAGLGGLISLMTKAQGKNEYQGDLVIIDHTSGVFKIP